VTIVRYEYRFGVEERRAMTPRICFDFCRTIPEMLYFGLTSGRECYCTPYYHQGTGDGACTAQCEGDASKTCGNTNGMSDVYEMHMCADTLEEAAESVAASQEAIAHATDVHADATHCVKGMDSLYDKIDDSTIRHPLQKMASEINVPTMALERKVTECQELEDTLDTTVGGVNAAQSSKTNAKEVLKIEKEERALKACTATLKADSKALKKLVDAKGVSNVFDSVGVTKEMLVKLGEALNDKFVKNPVSSETRAMFEDVAGCKVEDALGPDCAGSLSFFFNAGHSTQFLGTPWYMNEQADGDLDTFVEGMESFCMDMCAENERCNGGFFQLLRER
jgi:hypothetical protein